MRPDGENAPGGVGGDGLCGERGPRSDIRSDSPALYHPRWAVYHSIVNRQKTLAHTDRSYYWHDLRGRRAGGPLSEAMGVGTTECGGKTDSGLRTFCGHWLRVG